MKQITVDIPIEIFNSLESGMGRFSISQKFGLSDTQAREYCGAYRLAMTEPLDQFDITNEESRQAKVLLLDIETAPMRGYMWGIWNQNIGTSQIIEDWFMLTWSAKWLHNPEIMSNRLTSGEAVAKFDKRIVKNIWNLMDEADIVIAHNGIGFDFKRLNTRFLMNDVRLPSPYQVVDTLKSCRERFAFPSNKLDYIAKKLGFGGKVRTDFSLWDNCYTGSVEALKDMEIYNKNDVDILEKVYLKIRGYVKNHPNMGIYMDSEQSMCPVCSSKKLIESGEYVTAVSRFTAYHCSECFALLRGRKSVVGRDKRKDLRVSVVR